MSVNVNAILSSMTVEFVKICKSLDPPNREASCYTIIHSIPREMRVEAYSTDFVPKVFAIGPAHRGKIALRGGELKKWKSLHNMIDHKKEFLEKIINEVSMVTGVRECYEEQLVTGLLDETLVQIMVLDGCYIINTILGFLNGGFIDAKMQRARNDLLLLENQIPFTVLQCLFDSVTKISSYGSLNAMAQQYVAWPRAAVFCGDIPDQVHHLLHLFHSSLCPPKYVDKPCRAWFVPVFPMALSSLLNKEEPATRRSGRQGVLQNTPPDSVDVSCCRDTQWSLTLEEPVPGVPWRALQTATKLLEVGVKFRLSKEAGRSMIDVRFRHGYIEFPALDDQTVQSPALSLQSSTVSQFRNLLAFEECKPEFGDHVTVYLAFMNSLINTAKDVNLLVNCGVIENKLGSDEDAADFFNTAVDDKRVFLKLGKGHYLTQLFKDLEAYCAVRRHRYRAKLESDYLSSPWSIVSLIAGFVLLLLSLAQTFMSFYPYIHPAKGSGMGTCTGSGSGSG